MSGHQAMAFGTAGFTAARSVELLERMGLRPESGTLLVTGASGGVGSTAIAMLSAYGYRVAASTGSPETQNYLRELGVVT